MVSLNSWLFFSLPPAKSLVAALDSALHPPSLLPSLPSLVSPVRHSSYIIRQPGGLLLTSQALPRTACQYTSRFKLFTADTTHFLSFFPTLSSFLPSRGRLRPHFRFSYVVFFCFIYWGVFSNRGYLSYRDWISFTEQMNIREVLCLSVFVSVCECLSVCLHAYSFFLVSSLFSLLSLWCLISRRPFDLPPLVVLSPLRHPPLTPHPKVSFFRPLPPPLLSLASFSPCSSHVSEGVA